MSTPVAVSSEALAATPAATREVPAEDAPISTRRALAFVYAGYALRYAYLLVLIPYYGRVLGAEEYGRLLAAMSLYTMVWMLAEYGFPVVGARDAAACRDRTALADLFGRHVMGRLWMALPGLAVGVGGTLLSPLLHANPVLGALATANGLLAAFNLGWFFQGTLRFRTSVMLEAAGFAINLPLILLLVHGPGDSPVALAILLGSNLVCTLAAYAIAMHGIDRRQIRWHGGRQLVRDASALFAHKGFTMMMASSSTYLLSLFSSAAQVGWYGAAERLATVGLSLMQPANHVLVGTVARQISAKESEVDALRLMRGAAIAMTAFGVVLLLGTLGLASTAVPLILGPDFGPSVPMLCTLGLLFPFAALSQVIVSYVLIPLRHDALVSRVSVVAGVLTLLLIIVLAHLHDGTGVAWARVIGQVALGLVLVALLQRMQLIAKIWRGA
ncbi:MAG TPA: oligosaccharide flippase family protein [Burkholderiaceae bacterium]|nr:oligosaccharide flippase family protein [Burkholderiaceae bacterium]